jgi:peroxiredoxin
MTPEQQAAQQQALAAQSAEPAACAAEETETVLASAQAVIEEGQAAPEFTLKTAEGRSVSLRDYLGKDVLLVFGNTRCPFCSQKLPLLNRLQQAGDFEVIYIAMGTTPKPARQFVLDKKIQFTVLVDSNQFVGRAYGIRSIPEAFIIDREGIVQLQSASEGQALWYLLEGKPIPPSLNSARRSY